MDLLSSLTQYSDWGLLALRVAIAAIFLQHGLMKKGMWKMQPSEQMPAKMINQMRLLSIAEPLGAMAILFGFLTQWAAIGLGIIMLGAITFKTKVWHTPFMAQDKTGWELDFLILAACIALLLNGAGAISLDTL